MLPMLQTYTTKVLKPNVNGCCKKNILTQQMMNCENYKYVIKWDFDLNGKTITVPENCILEFDGGSLKNGTIIGQNTVYINVGDVDIWVENLTRGGTWKDHSGGSSIDVDDHLSDTSENPVQNKVINRAINEINEGKVDKIYGKTLTDNNFTNEEKSKLDGLPSNNTIQTLIANKQNALTFDDNPTLGSTNPVTSNGIKNALNTKMDAAIAAARLEEQDDKLELLNGNDVLVVADHTSVSSPDSQIIYREPGTNSYTDWMYQNGEWKQIVTHTFPGIDEKPTHNGNGIVKSGAVYDELSQIQIIGGIDVDIDGAKLYENTCIVLSTLKWTTSNSAYNCRLLNVKKLRGRLVRIISSDLVYMAILRDDSVVDNETPNFAEDNQIVYTNCIIYITEDTSYLYVLTKREGTDLEIQGLVDMDTYYNYLRKMLYYNGTVQLYNILHCGFTIASNNGTWISTGSYEAVIIPVMDYKGGRCRIVSNEARNVAYSFLKSLPKRVGDTPEYSDIYNWFFNLSTVKNADLTIPDDANYMYIYKRSGDTLFAPDSVTLLRKEKSLTYQPKIRLSKPAGSLELYGERVGGGYQSMAAYGNYAIFVYGGVDNDHLNATIYNIKTLERLCSVQLPYDGTDFGECHCNVAVFSRTFYNGNETLPLLYVSQWNSPKSVFVYNIEYNSDLNTATASLVQVITPDTALSESNKFGAGNGDYVVDYDNEELIHIGYCTGIDVYPPICISTFQLPSYNDGTTITTTTGITTKKVILSESDMLTYFGVYNMRGNQDKTYIAGQVFVGHGFSKQERDANPTLHLQPLSIGVIDLKTHNCTTIEIEEYNQLYEIECVEVFEGKLLIDGYHRDNTFNKNIYSVVV